jgi:hypothetical protein
MIDWGPIVGAAGVLVNVIVLPWAIKAYQARTGVQVTDQNRAAIYRTVETLTGQLQTKLDLGIIKPADLNLANGHVQADAKVAIVPVREAAADQNVTSSDLARLAIARVDTKPVSPVST